MVAFRSYTMWPLKQALDYSFASYEDILLANYDLYFRHAIRYGDYEVFRDAHPEIQLISDRNWLFL